MRSCLSILFVLLLSGAAAMGQPRMFLDRLPADTKESMELFVGYIVEGRLWNGEALPAELLTRLRQIFEPLNPRDGEWGAFDAAIGANSHDAHFFFDTLETCLNATVRMKGAPGDGVSLVDFEKPKGVAGNRLIILTCPRGRTAELTVADALILQMILRRTRGMHSVLS